MSLNGLDAPEILEASQTAQIEPAGWFILKYVSRDSVALLGRGKGGVAEARNAILQYPDASPLYGLIMYRRRKILIKYVPEGTSRLLQARTAVHLQDILERYSPYETLLEIASSTDLNDTVLAASFPLHTATQSVASSKLREISEDAEEGGGAGGAAVARPQGRQTAAQRYQERRAEQQQQQQAAAMMRSEAPSSSDPSSSEKPLPPAIQVNMVEKFPSMGTGPRSPGSPLRKPPYSRSYLVRDDSGHQSISSLGSPSLASSTTADSAPSPRLEKESAAAAETSAVGEGLKASSSTTSSSASAMKTLPAVQTGAAFASSTFDNLTSAGSTSFDRTTIDEKPNVNDTGTPETSNRTNIVARPSTSDVPSTNNVHDVRLPTGISESAIGRMSLDQRPSVSSTRQDLIDDDDPYDINRFFKPKVKLGPRPVTVGERSKRTTAGIASVPASYRPQQQQQQSSSNKKALPALPSSNTSSASTQARAVTSSSSSSYSATQNPITASVPPPTTAGLSNSSSFPLPPPPPIPDMPEYDPRPVSRGSIKSVPTHKSSTMTPDKLRLMKAVELRKKKLRKSQTMDAALAAATASSTPTEAAGGDAPPPVPALPTSATESGKGSPVKADDASIALERSSEQSPSSGTITIQQGPVQTTSTTTTSESTTMTDEAQKTQEEAPADRRSLDDAASPSKADDSGVEMGAGLFKSIHNYARQESAENLVQEAVSKAVQLDSIAPEELPRKTPLVDSSSETAASSQLPEVEGQAEDSEAKASEPQAYAQLTGDTQSQRVATTAQSGGAGDEAAETAFSALPTIIMPELPQAGPEHDRGTSGSVTPVQAAPQEAMGKDGANQNDELAAGAGSPRRSSDVARRRRGIVAPLSVDTEPDLSSSDEDEDDEFLDELNVATVEDARSVTVSKSPIATFINRRPSYASGQSEAQSVRTISGENVPISTTNVNVISSNHNSNNNSSGSNNIIMNSNNNMIPHDRFIDSPFSDRYIPSPSGHHTMLHTINPLPAAPFVISSDGSDPLSSARRNVSMGISQRIRALAEQTSSSRETSPHGPPSSSHALGHRGNSSDQTAPPASQGSIVSNGSSFNNHHAEQAQAQAFSQPHVWTTQHDPSMNGSGVSVSARIVRSRDGASSGGAGAFADGSSSSGLAGGSHGEQFRQSPLVINHNHGNSPSLSQGQMQAQTQTQQIAGETMASTSSSSATATAPAPTGRTHIVDAMAPASKNSSSFRVSLGGNRSNRAQQQQQQQPTSPVTTRSSNHHNSNNSISSEAIDASTLPSPTRAYATPLPTSSSSSSAAAVRNNNPHHPQAAESASLKSASTTNDSETGASTATAVSTTSSSRASRFFKRMSNFTSGGGSRRNASSVNSQAHSQQASGSGAGTSAAAANGAVANGGPPPSSGGGIASTGPGYTGGQSSEGVVVVGNLNVQFPDTLLWKRRVLTIDPTSGTLIFSVPQAMEHQKSIAKQFPLSAFRQPYLPDLDAQELPNSVLLDFVNGTTIQAAAEDAVAQRRVVGVLRREWAVWASSAAAGQS